MNPSEKADGGYSRKGQRPPGLSGKEIGMYYRNLAQSSPNSSGSVRKSQRPPGLSGKEIGMYYRNLSKQRKLERGENEEKQIHLGPRVDVPPGILSRIIKHLDKFINSPDSQHQENDRFEQQFRHLLSVDFEQFIEESKSTIKKQYLGNASLDERLKREYDERLSDDIYRKRLKQRKKLPTWKYCDDILQQVETSQVVLIVGSTGCGKTTQVPQILLDACIDGGRGSECRVVCTQPRRISAITVAERVAYERNEPLGSSVGYQIRLDSKTPRDRGSILYCTTGVLLQQLQSDPLMSDISVLVLDEIHERSVETDMLMGLLKIILPHRPDLKVILMSATVREQDFCDYFEQCPMFQIEGVAFPVEVHYLEDVLQETRYTNFESAKDGKRGRSDKSTSADEYKFMIEPYLRKLRGKYDESVLQALRCSNSEGCENIEFIQHLIYYICENKPSGAILVFMPGYDKISKLHAALTKPETPLGQLWSQKMIVYPMHSIMPTADQQAVFQRPPEGIRKVIISTIIAETSVTIDDVVYVINTGRTKMSSYNIETNIQSLDEVWVTKANSQQRKGRAGRVQPGVCYNLFTRAREATMADVPTPQILCSRLESIILSLKVLHISDPFSFLCTLLNPPVPEAIHNGVRLLKRIEALDANGVLTPLGTHLAKLPVEPQMGKMILMSALFRCLDPITSASAVLAYKSPFYSPLGLENRVDDAKQRLDDNMHSDHLMVHHVIVKYRRAVAQKTDRSFCYNNFLNVSTVKQLERMKQQFAELMHNAKFLDNANCKHAESNVNSSNMVLLRAIIAAGLYPNMAHMLKIRRIKNRTTCIHNMRLDDGKRANFHPSSVNSGVGSFESNFFVYFQKQKSNDLYLFDSTMVFPMALIIFGDAVETGVTPSNEQYISVGNAFYFKCNKETADVLLKLRHSLEELLLKKAMYPAPISRNEEQLISALAMLLSLDEVDEEPEEDNFTDEDN